MTAAEGASCTAVVAVAVILSPVAINPTTVPDTTGPGGGIVAVVAVVAPVVMYILITTVVVVVGAVDVVTVYPAAAEDKCRGVKSRGGTKWCTARPMSTNVSIKTLPSIHS